MKKLFCRSLSLKTACCAVLAFIIILVVLNDGQSLNNIHDVGVLDVASDSSCMYVTITDTGAFLHPDIQYRKEGQPKRHWTREIYYSDIDSVSVCMWDSLSPREKVNVIRGVFVFNVPDSFWKKHTDEENLRSLLSNTFIEWDCH